MNESERVTRAVAAHMNQSGWTDARSYHSGGGIWVVLFAEDRAPIDAEWLFGIAEDTWGGELRPVEDVAACEAYIETDIPSASTDYAAVASAIMAAVDAFDRWEGF